MLVIERAVFPSRDRWRGTSPTSVVTQGNSCDQRSYARSLACARDDERCLEVNEGRIEDPDAQA